MNGDLDLHPTGLKAEYSLLLAGGLHHIRDLTYVVFRAEEKWQNISDEIVPL